MYYYSTIRLILIYRPSEGGRLSRPRYCSKCAAPCPKLCIAVIFVKTQTFVRSAIRNWALSRSRNLEDFTTHGFVSEQDPTGGLPSPDPLSLLCTTPVKNFLATPQVPSQVSAGRPRPLLKKIQVDSESVIYVCVILLYVVGQSVWNALGNDLRDPDLNIASFGRLLKTHLFQPYSVHRAH